MWGRLALCLVWTSRLRRLGPGLATLTAGLGHRALWRRAAILACLRERRPDLLGAGGPGSAALADQLLCDTLGTAPKAIHHPGRIP